jgi:3-hydroxyacyl-[acyl-carrier-protein] dehydratase
MQVKEPLKKKSCLYDVKDILNILPHRYPFLLVDKILEIDLEKNIIIGQKNVTMNEPFFQGHFPDIPIMPGVLIIEALAQAGAVLAHEKLQMNKIAVLLSLTNVKFRRPVHPGDVLRLRCEGMNFSSKGGKVKAEAFVDDQLATQAVIGFVFANKDQI